MIKKTLLTTFTTLLFISQISIAHAAFIFESAENPTPNPTPNLGSLAVDDYFFPMHRFYLDSSYKIDAIGAYFEGSSNQTAFGALVSLSDQFDFPDSLDLSTPDLLTTTLVTVGSQDGDYQGALDITLDSGWYAVAFGTGRFGADDAGNGLALPNLLVDLALSEIPFTAILPGNPFNTPPMFQGQASTARMFVSGTPNAVSASGSAILFFAGIFMLFVRKQRVSK